MPAPLGVPYDAITPEIREIAQSMLDKMDPATKKAFAVKADEDQEVTLRNVISSDDPQITPEVRTQAAKELRDLYEAKRMSERSARRMETSEAAWRDG
jgi:hypothetical protein